MEKFSQEWFENEFTEMLKLIRLEDITSENDLRQSVIFLLPFLCGKYQLSGGELRELYFNFIDNTSEETLNDLVEKKVY